MLSFYVVIQSYDDIMSTCSLTSREHTAYPKWINDLLDLLTFFKWDTLDSVLDDTWEYLSNFRQDISFRYFALEELGSQNSWNSGLILASIGMELGFLLILAFGSHWYLYKRNKYKKKISLWWVILLINDI